MDFAVEQQWVSANGGRTVEVTGNRKQWRFIEFKRVFEDGELGAKESLHRDSFERAFPRRRVRCFACEATEISNPPTFGVPAEGWSCQADRSRYACPEHTDDLRRELGFSPDMPVDA